MYKLLNPFIWAINFLNYMAHLEMYRNDGNYELYDFNNDLRYF